MITLGTQDFKELYGYYSPELARDLVKYNEKGLPLNQNQDELLKGKSYFDMDSITDKYSYYFNKNLTKDKIYYLYKLRKLRDKVLNKEEYNSYYSKPCYKYISRFCNYKRFSEPLYTDYFSKQLLYSIVKYTMSSKGIHGFYTLLIPQSYIDPESIIKFGISKHASDVKIQLEDKAESADISPTNTGFKYILFLPTNIKNHINVYKTLRDIDKTYLLNQQVTFSIDYPKEFILFEKINLIVIIIAIIAVLLYIICAIIIQKYSFRLHIVLTQKLIFILSIIMFLPITGIGILSIIMSYNLDELIDINVRNDLHNSLENYSLLEKEILTRRFVSIIELKKVISNTSLSELEKNIAQKLERKRNSKQEYDAKIDSFSLFDLFEKKGSNKWDETKKWFNTYNSDYYFVFRNLNCCQINTDDGSIFIEDDIKEVINPLLTKYIKNLGLANNFQDENKELLSQSIIEQYVNPKYEEKYVPQESISTKDIVTFSKFDSAIYFNAKDINKINYLLYAKTHGKNDRPFRILNYYSNIKPFWYQPKYRYAYDTDIAATIYFDSSYKDNKRLQFPVSSIHSNINKLLNRVLKYSDSGYEKIKKEKETTINEYIFSNDSAFVIAGTTKSIHNNNLSFSVKILFPFLMTYAILLLVLISNLISSFINKPIKIYQEALEKLEENHFGTQIDSFSKDEFNNITIAFNEMSSAIKQKEQIKRYVSERLIQSVDRNQIQEAGNGKQEKVTLLSSDIRNFTGISEQYEPSVIVEMLNSYFTRMQQAISSNGGIIDKYIGDAIQAVFYEESGKENQVLRAAKTALEMRKALTKLNEERKEAGLFTIENGIGIDTDFAVTGTIGTSKGRKDFSVNGEVIDRASELEAKTKLTESKILISKKSIEKLDVLVYKEFDENSVELIDVRE